MQSVCVYCGSSASNEASYIAAAKALGTSLGRSGRRLVYGGAHVGLMGAVADAALAAGAEVLGVMPRSLVEIEVQHDGLTELVIVDSMHERKAHMVAESDGFIAMPGGFGTLDELFETLTWAQLGYHAKPIGILNVQGYFDDLLVFLENAVAKQLVKQQHLDMLLVASSGDELLEKMVKFRPVTTRKWP
jgi:hypothetical protein